MPLRAECPLPHPRLLPWGLCVQVVGVSERMDESVCVLRSALHLPSATDTALPRINANSREEEGESETVPDWLVRWDRLLYEAAVERLEADLLRYPHCRR